MRFRCMFHLDVAYVALTIHVCCKCMFQMFHLFRTYVASVLSVSFICCNGHTRILQMYVSSVLNICCKCFSGCCICYRGYTHILQAYVSLVSDVCCSKCFMLQVFALAGAVCFMRFRCMFHLNVACVSSGCWKSRSSVANVDLVPTCMHAHGRAAQKKSERAAVRGHGRGWSPPACTGKHHETMRNTH
jgi:hypothetical protein